jgi:hypothetical protein
MEPTRTLMAEWKPNRWIAALLSLFLNPFGMLYLQRPAFASPAWSNECDPWSAHRKVPESRGVDRAGPMQSP